MSKDLTNRSMLSSFACSLILAGLFSCSSYRCFSSSLAVRRVVSCLRLLSHQNYGTEIVMMFSFLLCLRLLLRAASLRVFSRAKQNNVFVLMV